MIPTPTTKLMAQSAESARNPYSRPLDLDTLSFTRRILSLRWSANGEHIYFDTNITGRFNIWRVPASGGWPVQITVSDERTLLEDPSPDGRFLLYKQDMGGNEKPNLFLVDLRTGTTRNITNTEKIGYRHMHWSPDGKALSFAAEREKPGAYSIFLINPDDGAVRKLIGNETGECLYPKWSPDGSKIAFTRTVDYLHTGVSVFEIESRTESVLIPIDGKSTAFNVGWTHDGEGIFINSNANEQGTDAAALFALEKNSLEWLTLKDWESYVVDCSRNEDSFVYVLNEAGNHRVFLRTLRGGEVEIPFPSGVLDTARFSPDGKKVGFLHSSADSPEEIWVYDTSTRQLKQISHSLVGGLEQRNFVRPQRVVYPSFDGTSIAAFLYMPANIEPNGAHPAIVLSHGGPNWQHMNGWSELLQYLVSVGFVVIAPNYRGSTGFGRVFMESNRRDAGGGDLQDCVASVDFLKKTGYVDPRRVAFMGGSYGGYLTLMALTKFPELWAAGVAIVPFANWFTAHKNEDPPLQANDEWFMGDPKADQELWHDRSPIFFVDRVRAPLLLLAGANDIRCPVGETEQMAEAVRKKGGIVEVRIYENEGHGFSRRENEIDANRRAARFLETYAMTK